MPRITIPATNRGLISTFGQYYNRTSNSFSGILGTATYPNQPLSNTNLGYSAYGTGTGSLFWINIANSNATKGSVSITYPWSETASGTSTIGNNRQIVVGTYGYIGINCFTNYGYTFIGWYTLPTGGTLISSSSSVNIYPDGYTSYLSTVWYARYA